MAGTASTAIRPAGWSSELQDLQDETVRLLQTIRGGSGSSRQQQPHRHGSHGEGSAPTKGVKDGVHGLQERSKSTRRRRRRRRTRATHEATQGHETASLGVSGPRKFSYSLDTAWWSGEEPKSNIPTTDNGEGMRKTTVEVLDKGEDTPRSPPDVERPTIERHSRDGGGGEHSGNAASSTTPIVLQGAGVAAAGEEESRFRSLTFKTEEGRVRDGFDVYTPGGGGVGEELRRLRAERDRLGSIEEAQRKLYRGAKRQEFLRFARRKWLASDRAAETVQKTFRAYIGRKRAGLAAEVRRLTGKARMDWVEVRDHSRGEAWYFNPLTGKSQWDRPDSLLGTITPSDKVKTLPALGPRSPSKHPPSVGPETHDGYIRGKKSACKNSNTAGNAAGAGGVVDSAGSTVSTTVVAGKMTQSGRAQTAPGLPPLAKGWRHSALPSVQSTHEIAPSSGLGGELAAVGGATEKGRSWRGKQEAWVGEGEEIYPFATEEEVLPDDRFEETGLGLARRGQEDGGSPSSDDSDDEENDKRGFFLADGTPNIRLRRTIAQALKVTKFDSVSTLLADYTGRKIAAAADSPIGDAVATAPGASVSNARRAVTAGAIGCSQTKGKRSRSQNTDKGNTDAAGGISVSRNAPYPTGKLEEDKTPSLFGSSIVRGGRKMVSVMVGAASSGSRRGKRTGTRAAGERGGALKGLAIRDLTPPGFLPSSNGIDSGAANGIETVLKKNGEGATPEADAGVAGHREERGGDPVTGDSGNAEQKVQEICFNCWSKGSGKTCTLHMGAKTGRADGAVGHEGKTGEARPAESALMCKNWDIGVMRRRYRSEELQEVFAKEASSLKYDKERKKFISVVEQKHPIYRLLAKTIARYNFTVRRKLHQKNWLRGFVEQMRMGKLAGVSAEEIARTAKVLRLRNTLQNSAQVKAFTATAIATQPQAPVTGSTVAERQGLVRVLVDRPSAVMGRVTRVVLDGPRPVPEALYEARRYSLPRAKTMPMPEPRYLDVDSPDHLEEALQDVGGQGGRLHNAAWLPRFCMAAAGDLIRSAVTNVEVMSPLPGADDIARTKYPPPLTIKFATFSRKPTSGMMAVGGLPAEMVVHMLVSTRTPPQYGNFTVMQKSSIAPTVSKECSAEYESLELLVENQAFLPRALQHPLNQRRAPTIMAKTLMADPENRHYFGLNRPEQTGEAESHGFRTSSHADAAPALPTLDPTAFTPSEDVVTPNLCSANRTVTTHADRSYPFCEPSNRSTTTLDFYHLLLTATCSPNKEQVFTNLGVQECGEFMRGSDPLRPMGHCIGMVYRSWAFLQRQAVEEFETDDGIPYWFDRRTGETFWERPLCEEEKVPVKEGGTILGGQGERPDSSSGAFEEIKPRYDQQQMRKLMMRSHEGMESLEKRRKQVATEVKWARSSGALPPPDPNDLEPPAQDPDADDLLEPEEDESNASPGDVDGSSRSNSLPRAKSRQNDLGRSSVIGSRNDHQGRGAQGISTTLGAKGNGSGRGRGEAGGKGSGHGVCGGNGGKADRLVASIAQALNDAGLNEEGRQVQPSDMLHLGMGLGITLGANGLLKDLDGEAGMLQASDARDGARTPGADGGGDIGGVETSLAPPVIKISPNGHPIGHGHAEPIAGKEDSNVLDHKSEAEHLASIVRDNAGLKTSEEFKGLLVVPATQPTPCPDDEYTSTKPEEMEADPRRKAELSTPIIAYPETLWKKQYRGHGAAGEGQSWQPAGGDRAANQRAKSSLGAPMRRTNETLPEGFLNAISHTHVGKQHCDYLPHIPNMPQARAVGRVRPRSAAEDWFAVGFDPWSAGREPLSAEFIPTLSIKQEDLGADEDGGGAGTVPQAGYLELKDSAGHAEMAVVSAEKAKLDAEFGQITSWARHGRYADVETAMNQADWTMPIDFQNDLGLTLLHVAAQNGNKRIAKLCLRKGADINKRNNSGQTPLHYAYSYGFESFGEYLISKGADDSITNADGLTCYEGLNETNLGQL